MRRDRAMFVFYAMEIVYNKRAKRKKNIYTVSHPITDILFIDGKIRLFFFTFFYSIGKQKKRGIDKQIKE